MAYETIACLQDHGLEVILDFEHAMDANCGRRENGNLCDADFHERSLDYFNQLTAQCVSQKVSRIVICDTTAAPIRRKLQASSADLHRLILEPASDSMAIPTVDLAWPTPVRPFLPEPSRRRAHCWAPASAAAT